MSKGKEIDLFSGDEEFNKIHESDIQFPLCVKNNAGNIYTFYLNEEKFQQITISKEHENFRGDILFGFNESFKLYKGDLKLWYHCMLRTNVIIEQTEYQNVYDILMEGFNEFMTGNSDKYIELVIPKEKEKYLKHKWKPLPLTNL